MDAQCRMATTFLGSARGPGSRMRLDLVRGDARNEVAANQAADMAVRRLNDPKYEEFQLQNAQVKSPANSSTFTNGTASPSCR